MTSKPLDLSTITNLLARNEKDEKRATLGVKAPEWPDMEGKTAILNALSNGLDAVKIGKRYFGITPRPTSGSVWIGPLDGGFVPCGEFTIRKLQMDTLDNG